MPPTPRPTPLPAALAVTIINSLGTGVVINGVFFLAKSRYAFSESASFLLGVLIGLTYIPAALAIGPLLARLAHKSKRLCTRTVLAAVIAAMALACALPIASDASPSLRGPWAVWAFLAVYAPLSGVLWPIVESYVSGGRRGRALGSAIGWFNIAWSAAVAASFWFIAPFVHRYPLHLIAALGAIQAAGLACLPLFTPEPLRPGHLDDPCPPIYRRFLTIFRLQLPASYVVIAALSSYIPFTLHKLSVPPAWETPIASVWMAARIGVFALLGFWSGWHGRWWPTWLGAVLMIAGFAAVIASGLFPASGLPALVAGLAAFGVGASVVYCAALYYVMEVGSAQVAAGGSHEALIGLGYALGPLCGLAAVGARSSGLAASIEWPMVLLVCSVASLFAALAFLKAFALRDATRNAPPPVHV